LKGEAAVGFEPTNKGFADLRLRPLGNAALKNSETQFLCKIGFYLYGAGNGTRTRDINLGKVALYQLSYSRIYLNV
jgi:hypothetical protein